MKLAEESIVHLRGLLRIAEDLRAEGIALYGHEYHPMSFGSFSVEFGRPHYRVLCQWDGKESLLSVSFAEVQNSNAPRKWTHDANISLPGGEGVYEEIASNVHAMVTT
jgi:hypothetical protein